MNKSTSFKTEKAVRALIVLALYFFPGRLLAQDEGDPISLGVFKKIDSHILGEERTIAVSLPVDYGASAKRYPVLYVLDADYDSFAAQVGLVHFLSGYRAPETIIVGLLNTNRNRDFWSHQIDGLAQTTDDGADNFLNFFSDELIPFIDRSYRTTKHRTIYGRSAGGHFVTHALLARPHLFEAYLASSPVLGFSDVSLLRRAEEFFSGRSSLLKSYFIYYGNTDYTSVVETVPLLETILRQKAPSDFSWKVKRVEGRHGPPESLLELLLMLYPEWQPVCQPVIVPSNGELLDGGSINVEVTGTKDPIYYTLSGEDPNRSSPRYAGPITVESTTTLKAKAIRGDLQESRIVSAQFSVVDEMHPSVDVGNPTNGLKYKYVEKQSFQTPDEIVEPPTKSGVVSTVDIGVRERDQFYLLQFDGFIKVPTDGCYRFTFVSNGTKIFIDNSPMVSGHGLMPVETVREVCLEAGYHAIRTVSCILTEPTHQLDLYWEGEGIEKQKVPAEVFFVE